MRNLCEVLKSLKSEIPSSKRELHQELDRISSSSMIAAPEMQHFWWTEAACALAESIPQPAKEPWQLKVIEIWRTDDSQPNDEDDD